MLVTLKGVYKNCFEDPRTTLVIDDAFKWFDRQFPHSACKSTTDKNKFDVIILDLLDPELIPDAPFAEKLYSKEMMKNLACALKDDGVFVSQVCPCCMSNRLVRCALSWSAILIFSMYSM